MRFDCHGWSVITFQQVHIPPFLDYVAIARQDRGEKTIMFNVEGRSLQEAVDKVRKVIDERATASNATSNARAP